MSTQPDFILILRPIKDPVGNDRPAIQRLRIALKVLLRQQGLRCVRISEQAPIPEKDF